MMPVETRASEEPLRRIKASITTLGIVWDAMRHGANTDKEQAADAIYSVIEALQRDAEELNRVIWRSDEEAIQSVMNKQKAAA